MSEKREILGFLHYRTDLGDGVRTGVVFSGCTEGCGEYCASYRFIPEHDFCEDFSEQKEYTADEMIAYLLEEKTMYYAGKLGISFLGKEPLRDPFFCADVARGLKKAGIGLQVYTCGMCSMSAFELLDGLVDTYILRIFLSAPADGFDRKRQVGQVVDFLENRKNPYRILLIVTPDVTCEDTELFAEGLLGLKALKSVILDFSHFAPNEDARLKYRRIFLKRRIPLY